MYVLALILLLAVICLVVKRKRRISQTALYADIPTRLYPISLVCRIDSANELNLDCVYSWLNGRKVKIQLAIVCPSHEVIQSIRNLYEEELLSRFDFITQEEHTHYLLRQNTQFVGFIESDQKLHYDDIYYLLSHFDSGTGLAGFTGYKSKWVYEWLIWLNSMFTDAPIASGFYIIRKNMLINKKILSTRQLFRDDVVKLVKSQKLNVVYCNKKLSTRRNDSAQANLGLVWSTREAELHHY